MRAEMRFRPAEETELKESIFKKYLEPDRFIFVLIFLMLIERIVMFFLIGPEVISDSDDVAYLASGKYFAQTGTVSVWLEMPSALIMPAMPFVTGIFYMIFGESAGYIVSLKILWIIIGLFTPYFVYKILSMFVPKWYGILGASVFLLPNFAWMDNVILTETPYLLFFTMCLYYTFCMAESRDKKYFVLYIVSFMLALCFRANILSMPVFTAIYLLIKKTYSGRELLKRLLVFACASMIFFVPWTIRNYIQFNDFIPVSYGAPHPTMKGTYQGEGYPEDDQLDYEKNVDEVFLQDYAEYFDGDGNPKDPDQRQYLSNMRNTYIIKYRLSEWFKNDPASLIKSYLILKPYSVLNWPWYWGPYETQVTALLGAISKINCVLCAAAVLLSLIRKKKRLIVLYLSAMYVVNLYVLAMSFASERYAAMIMPLRYMLGIIGIWLIADCIKNFIKKRKQA